MSRCRSFVDGRGGFGRGRIAFRGSSRGVPNSEPRKLVSDSSPIAAAGHVQAAVPIVLSEGFAMWTKQGRCTVLDIIQGIVRTGTQAVVSSELDLVLSDIAESEEWTDTDAALWTRAAVGADGTIQFTSLASVISGVPTLPGDEVLWTNTTGGSVTVYGWLLQVGYTRVGTPLLNYKRFDTPTVVLAGAVFRFTPGLRAPLPT